MNLIITASQDLPKKVHLFTSVFQVGRLMYKSSVGINFFNDKAAMDSIGMRSTAGRSTGLAAAGIVPESERAFSRCALAADATYNTHHNPMNINYCHPTNCIGNEGL